jgi:hypothetical protein
MLRQRAIIVSDAFLPSQPGDWHDVSGHHRYYGSSAFNGGERIVETRRGRQPTLAEISNFTGMMP